jgi:hypothetical protein
MKLYSQNPDRSDRFFRVLEVILLHVIQRLRQLVGLGCVNMTFAICIS